MVADAAKTLCSISTPSINLRDIWSLGLFQADSCCKNADMLLDGTLCIWGHVGAVQDYLIWRSIIQDNYESIYSILFEYTLLNSHISSNMTMVIHEHCLPLRNPLTFRLLDMEISNEYVVTVTICPGIHQYIFLPTTTHS